MFAKDTLTAEDVVQLAHVRECRRFIKLLQKQEQDAHREEYKRKLKKRKKKK